MNSVTATPTGPKDPIPTYALYGEAAETPLELWVHCESIPSRSSLFDWEIGLHRHETFFQILYLSCGSGEFRLAEARHALKPAVLLTVPPRAVHGFHFSADVQGYVVTVRVERIEAMLAAVPAIRALFARPQLLEVSSDVPGEVSGAGSGDSTAAARMGQRIEAIATESASSRTGQSALLEANLVILLIEMARLIEGSPDPAEGPAPGRNHHARQFQALVDRHFRVERAVAFYAGELGISETHLNRVARSAFDLSALGVITQRLVREAARDLTFTTIPVKEIAYSLGFEDPAYFSRFFTKNMGAAPSVFRAEQARRAGDRRGRR